MLLKKVILLCVLTIYCFADVNQYSAGSDDLKNHTERIISKSIRESDQISIVYIRRDEWLRLDGELKPKYILGLGLSKFRYIETLYGSKRHEVNEIGYMYPQRKHSSRTVIFNSQPDLSSDLVKYNPVLSSSKDLPILVFLKKENTPLLVDSADSRISKEFSDNLHGMKGEDFVKLYNLEEIYGNKVFSLISDSSFFSVKRELPDLEETDLIKMNSHLLPSSPPVLENNIQELSDDEINDIIYLANFFNKSVKVNSKSIDLTAFKTELGKNIYKILEGSELSGN